jgi:hypothetical protein
MKNLIRSYVTCGMLNWGYLTLRLILVVTTYCVISRGRVPEPQGPMTATASIADLLPIDIQTSRTFQQILIVVYVVFAVCWFFGKFPLFSAILTTVSFTVLIGIKYEHASGVSHTFHLTNQLLIIYCGWFLCDKESIKNLKFKEFKGYPAWLPQLCLFTVCWFFFSAGLTKLLYSGLDWANGLSLQCWVHQWGKDNLLTRCILKNITLAKCFQWLALLTELTSGLLLPFFLFARQGESCNIVSYLKSPFFWRLVLGVGLIGMLAAFIVCFGYHFKSYALWVFLFLIPTQPFYEWLITRYYNVNNSVIKNSLA